MIHLALMRTNVCEWLDLAISSDKENAGLLSLAKYALLKRYQDFEGIINDYKVCPASSTVTLTASVIKEFYASPPKKLREMLVFRRRKHELDECPYCGYPLPPRTLDHFLPKEHWPEYAIYANNLVPQCSSCAPIKGQRYYCNNHCQAMFLHPMYSSALSTVRFYIEISLVDNQPKFEPIFNITDDVSTEDEERIKLHIKSLHVKERMIEYCHEQYRRWIRIVSLKGCDVKESFKVRLKERALDSYASNWSIAFYQGVLRNSAVITDLQSRAPHGPPLPPEKVRRILMDD
ncbi:hypothetical protein [Laribacter hongkongensis]|uniref:hypothetical protein n=1 Tax=Laribacter hongkongensis TaxID=168471 RepID=UPI00146A98D8|nr:hypothetical protein [Laribacter hongkongensis]